MCQIYKEKYVKRWDNMKCPLCVRDGSGKGGNIELWKYKIPLNGNKKCHSAIDSGQRHPFF